MTGVQFKSALVPAVLMGAAAGNIAVAPFIGQGSLAWLVFVFLMFVSVAAPAVSFSRLLVFAVLSLPAFCFWRAVHQFHQPLAFLAIECVLIVLSSQAAGLSVVAYQMLRGRSE